MTASTVRLELSDGDWIEIKERLSYGEQQRLAGAALGKMTPGADAEIGLNWAMYNIERLSLWIVDWSFNLADGKDAPLNKQTIAALDPATVEEIDAAITAHIEHLEAAAKNATIPAEPEAATK